MVAPAFSVNHETNQATCPRNRSPRKTGSSIQARGVTAMAAEAASRPTRMAVADPEVLPDVLPEQGNEVGLPEPRENVSDDTARHGGKDDFTVYAATRTGKIRAGRPCSV